MSSPHQTTIYLCSPRGFCAGVVRAIDVVQAALKRFGAPVYVRHEIVHNRYVVEDLKSKGAIFVEELNQIPETDAPVIFSAHGVPKSVPEEARFRHMFAIDATCPLVTKVHREAMVHFKRGRHIFLIGHDGHPEVVGTMGQLPQGAVTLLETVDDVNALVLDPCQSYAYVTQTTLSVDDTRAVVDALRARCPQIAAPHKEDICYATTNRQEAVKKVAPLVEGLLVVGAPNSSNSQRLREVALKMGTPHSVLIERAADIPWDVFASLKRVGLTAGASAPEILVEEVIGAFKMRGDIRLETITAAQEDVFFPLPRALRDDAA